MSDPITSQETPASPKPLVLTEPVLDQIAENIARELFRKVQISFQVNLGTGLYGRIQSCCGDPHTMRSDSLEFTPRALKDFRRDRFVFDAALEGMNISSGDMLGVEAAIHEDVKPRHCPSCLKGLWNAFRGRTCLEPLLVRNHLPYLVEDKLAKKFKKDFPTKGYRLKTRMETITVKRLIQRPHLEHETVHYKTVNDYSGLRLRATVTTGSVAPYENILPKVDLPK